MTYIEAHKAIREINELLKKDGMLKRSYTAQWYAVMNMIEKLATQPK